MAKLLWSEGDLFCPCVMSGTITVCLLLPFLSLLPCTTSWTWAVSTTIPYALSTFIGFQYSRLALLILMAALRGLLVLAVWLLVEIFRYSDDCVWVSELQVPSRDHYLIHPNSNTYYRHSNANLGTGHHFEDAQRRPDKLNAPSIHRGSSHDC